MKNLNKSSLIMNLPRLNNLCWVKENLERFLKKKNNPLMIKIKFKIKKCKTRKKKRKKRTKLSLMNYCKHLRKDKENR